MFRRVGDFTLCRHHWERMWGDGFSAFAEEEISELRARWGEERQRSESMRHAGQRAARAERRRTAGHIYYVRRVSDGLIKIGTTQSLKQRLGTLRSQYGEMEVLLTHDGGSDQETELHRRFGAWQVRGEWFHPGRPLFTWILQQRRDHSIRGTQLREAVGITGLEALRVGSLTAPPPRRYVGPKRRAS